MTTECFSVTHLPGLSRLYLDYCASEPAVERWYGSPVRDRRWQAARLPHDAAHRADLAEILSAQNPGAEHDSALADLKAGANTVVTGQQVGLFGGPLFTIHKAATAIAQARLTTAAGYPHLPIFWLASEDHDFAEINHVTFPNRRELVRLNYANAPETAIPVGRALLDETITPLLDRAYDLLGYSDAMDWLSAAYKPGKTLAEAFAEFYRNVFAAEGLLVLDAAGRDVHQLGAPVLLAAINRADELHAALIARNKEIAAAGYAVQVAVADKGSLLFLIDEKTGARVALKRTAASAAEPQGLWHAGRHAYSTADLAAILAAEPERISPSALLRPVFQDAILPTTAYIGGAAEAAYFAQSAVLYERILGRLTPILPRLSATLVEPAIADLLHHHEISFETVLSSTEDRLAHVLGARAIPIAGKQRLASAGNALDSELASLTDYMSALDEGLGRSAQVAASKMRYQMNRLRRLTANFELEKEASLRRHAQAIVNALHPEGGLQERLIGAAFPLARHGESLIRRLIHEAGDGCPGHKVIPL